MKTSITSNELTLAIIAPTPPPFGGVANQAILLEKLLRKSRVDVYKIPTNRSPAFIELLIGRIPGFRTFVRELSFLTRIFATYFKCDVVHILACSHLYFFLNVIPSILLARLFRKFVLVNYRGGEAHAFFNGFGKRFVWVLRKANRVTVPSEYLRKVFEDFHIDSLVIPNIIDLHLFAFRLPTQNNKTRFICTRNFESYYDVPTVVRAFRIVKDTLIDAKLTLIGDGSQKPELDFLLKQLQLESSVKILGRVDQHEIPKYLVTEDIFVNPSIVDNYPNSILEAFACGLPVVTTSAGGIPYLVKNGTNGLLVNPGDYEAMARAMIRLSKDHELCLKLAKAGKATADNHSWSAVWPQLRRVYQLS